MSRASPEPVGIAILAKAPIPGLAKTRLAPAIGAQGAAALQARLIARAVTTACTAQCGPVTLWAAPDASHALFQDLAARFAITLARQSDGDLGARMHAACVAAQGPVLIIGTDAPALTPEHLRHAAQALRGGRDAVVIPAEDGGYVLIGLARPTASLFTGMTWSTSEVMAETRRRIAAARLAALELAPLWDVDRPEDLARLRAFAPEVLD
jgi:rSAM/selenodomain-associated transferase 1